MKEGWRGGMKQLFTTLKKPEEEIAITGPAVSCSSHLSRPFQLGWSKIGFHPNNLGSRLSARRHAGVFFFFLFFFGKLSLFFSTFPCFTFWSCVTVCRRLERWSLFHSDNYSPVQNRPAFANGAVLTALYWPGREPQQKHYHTGSKWGREWASEQAVDLTSHWQTWGFQYT